MHAIASPTARLPDGRSGFADAAACAPAQVVTDATFVDVTLGYVLPSARRPLSYLTTPPPGTPAENYGVDLRRVRVADLRPAAAATSLDAEGFELRHAPSSVDFHDDRDVRARYHAECAALACAATGAHHARVFDHLVRRREAGRPPLTFGRDDEGPVPGGVGRVHNDYSEASGRRRAAFVLGIADAAALRRFAIVNLWRSIGAAPVQDTPLAVCDARSVDAHDLVPTTIRYADRDGEIVLLAHSPRHRWAFFDRMRRDEVLLFKQYDSQLAGTARFVPHAAFDLPRIAPDAPLRESIEVRCLVVFE